MMGGGEERRKSGNAGGKKGKVFEGRERCSKWCHFNFKKLNES